MLPLFKAHPTLHPYPHHLLPVTMPKNSYTGESYDVTSRGVNDQVCTTWLFVKLGADESSVTQGNSYDHRVSESGGHSYHYSNKCVPDAVPEKCPLTKPLKRRELLLLELERLDLLQQRRRVRPVHQPRRERL